MLLKHCNFVTIIVFYKMASKQKKRKIVTEADIDEFIENLDNEEYSESLITMTIMRRVFVICRMWMRTIQITYDL